MRGRTLPALLLVLALVLALVLIFALGRSMPDWLGFSSSIEAYIDGLWLTLLLWLLLLTGLLSWRGRRLRRTDHRAQGFPRRAIFTLKAVLVPKGLRWPNTHRWLGVALGVLCCWLLLLGCVTLYRAPLEQLLSPALRLCCQDYGAQIAQESPQARLLRQQHELRQVLAFAKQPAFIAQAPEFDSLQTAPRFYLEFASSATPYLQLAWPAAKGGLWHATLRGDTGELLQAPVWQAFGEHSRSFAGQVFDWHYQLISPVGRWLCVGVALGVLGLVLSGLWQWARDPARLWRADGLMRWHLALALLSAPALCWVFGTSLLTAFGQWRSLPASIDVSAYYARLYPMVPTESPPSAEQTPALPSESGPKAVNSTSMNRTSINSNSINSTAINPNPNGSTAEEPLALAARFALVQELPWPVSKLQWQRADQSWLLSEDARSHAPWQGRALGQVGLSATGEWRWPAAELESEGWRWRHRGYQWHQALTLSPAVRLLLAIGSFIGALAITVSLARVSRQRPWLAWGLVFVAFVGPVGWLGLAALASAWGFEASWAFMASALCAGVISLAIGGWAWWRSRPLPEPRSCVS